MHIKKKEIPSRSSMKKKKKADMRGKTGMANISRENDRVRETLISRSRTNTRRSGQSLTVDWFDGVK